MKTIPVADVIIPKNRQRRVFKEDSIRELTNSIKSVGLLHPIVLRQDERTLVVGERRLRAVALIGGPYRCDGCEVPKGQVPYLSTGDLTSTDLFQAELEENILRVDLRWDERAKAIKALHDLRSRQNPHQTATATAEEIAGEKLPNFGPKVTEVSNAILLAPFLDDPLVSNAPDMKTAIKVVREELKRRDRRERLQNFSQNPSSHQIFQADCYIDAPARCPGLFDVIVTDPPYGIDAHEKDPFDVSHHEYDDSDETFTRVLQELPRTCFAVTRPQAHVYVFCDIRRFTELFVAFELGGFVVWPKPLIWDKGNTGSYGNIEYGFRACYDAILFARKGDRKVTAGYRDVINLTQPTNLPHPAGKPPELYEDILRRSALPGDKVADLFCGSFPLVSAAKKLKLIAYGWENNEKYYHMGLDALRKASE